MTDIDKSKKTEESKTALFSMFSTLSRRRQRLTEDVVDMRAQGKSLSSLLLCMQVALVFVSILVLLFGLAVSAVGLWALQSQKSYFAITDGDTDLTRLPFSMIVAGIFVSLLAVLGLLGGIFTKTMSGGILLAVFSFVLVLLIISEIGAGAAAIQFREEIKETYIESALRSLMFYEDLHNSTNTAEEWNKFQTIHCCCGARNFTSYREVFDNNTVPRSCCINSTDIVQCDDVRMNVTAQTAKGFIHMLGCPETVVEELRKNLISLAVVAIVIGSAQFIGVAMACCVAYVSSKVEERKSYTYNRLIQETT